MEAAVERARESQRSIRDASPLPSAPPEVVKAAYRALAVLNHPDKGGETEVMQRINAAYRRLAA
jgi:curved DNA-binding protein CbpA